MVRGLRRLTGNGWDPADPSSSNNWENQAFSDHSSRPLPPCNCSAGRIFGCGSAVRQAIQEIKTAQKDHSPAPTGRFSVSRAPVPTVSQSAQRHPRSVPVPVQSSLKPARPAQFGPIRTMRRLFRLPFSREQ